MVETKALPIRLQAKDVMTAPVFTVRPETSVRDIAALMLTYKISGLPVVTPDEELLGIVTEADLLYKESGLKREELTFWKALPLGRMPEAIRKAEGVSAADLMSSPVLTVEEDTPLREVAAVMVRRKINRLPVMRAGRLVGIVSRNDILRAFVRTDQELAKAVREGLLHGLWIDVTPLKIDVMDGVVYLEGEVDRRSDKMLAEQWVSAIDGVIKVDSTLTYRHDDRRVTANVGPWDLR